MCNKTSKTTVIHHSKTIGTILRFIQIGEDGQYDNDGDLYDEIPNEIIVNNNRYIAAARDESSLADLDQRYPDKKIVVKITTIYVSYMFDETLYFGSECPHCRSEDFAIGSIENAYIDGEATARCNECNGEWTEHWAVVAITLEDNEE